MCVKHQETKRERSDFNSFSLKPELQNSEHKIQGNYFYRRWEHNEWEIKAIFRNGQRKGRGFYKVHINLSYQTCKILTLHSDWIGKAKEHINEKDIAPKISEILKLPSHFISQLLSGNGFKNSS